MPTEHKRFVTDGGIGFNVVSDPKFKTNIYRVRFLTSFDRKKAAARAIVPGILTSCNSEFPNSPSFSRRLNYLYGAAVSCACRHCGGMFEISVSVSSIRSRFAPGDEDISGEAAALLRDCIFSPAVENGGFNAREFNIQKLNLLSEIDGELNDKPSYAEARAAETAYRGESAAERWYGSREDVEALTPEAAYEAYKEILLGARVEIGICGGGEFDNDIKLFEDAFSALGTCKRSCPEYRAFSPIKPEPEYAETRLDVAQANLIMVFKSERFDPNAALLFSWLYGDTPFSKLFMNVREKLGLCYYISAIYSESKNSLTVSSGVAPENVNAARDEIIRQLGEISSGNFTEEELEKTRLAMFDSYRSIYCSVPALDNWFFNQTVRRGSAVSPAERMAEMQKITSDDIVAAAGSFKLDTVYVLTDSGR